MKASDILEVVQRSDGLLYIEDNINQPGFNSVNEASEFIEKWDNVDGLEAENKCVIEYLKITLPFSAYKIPVEKFEEMKAFLKNKQNSI